MGKNMARGACYLGAVVCVLTPLAFANMQQEMWPLPGLYLAEVALAGLIAASLAAESRRPAVLSIWIISGILLAFTYLGGFSIGPFLAPAFLLLLIAAILKSRGDRQAAWRGLLSLAAAALAQGALMIALINLI
jgi:hypothetical protein